MGANKDFLVDTIKLSVSNLTQSDAHNALVKMSKNLSHITVNQLSDVGDWINLNCRKTKTRRRTSYDG